MKFGVLCLEEGVLFIEGREDKAGHVVSTALREVDILSERVDDSVHALDMASLGQ